jgi:3-phenylpropionate/trans-cinnamate dioxygenase ferredoxin component
VQWVDLGAVDSTAAGEWLTGELDGCPVAVVRVAGVLHAFEDRCTHDGQSLAGAELEGCTVICPRHGARFSLETGAALSPPAYEPVRIFPVREAGARVLVGYEP